MSHKKDDWEKHRSRGNHLTQQEIEQLRRRHRAGWKPRDAARELKCSSRVAYKYFAMFGGYVRPQPYRPVVSLPETEQGPVDRFYRGNFEL